MLDFDIIPRSRPRVGLIFALSVVIFWIPRFGFASEVLEQKFDGIVVPRLWVQVTPQIHGIINQVLFEPGQRVSKGDPLFEIEPGDFAVNVRIAQAELNESHARLSIAEDAAGRQRVLVAQNSTPQQVARQSEFDVEIARAIDARNEAALAKAQLALSRTHVLAGISGIVGRPHVAPGTLVEPTTGTVLAEIAQLDPILVSFDVPFNERQRVLDKAGTTTTEELLFQRLKLSLELPSGRIYERSGKPEHSGTEINQSTGMLTIWAEFSNPDRVLLPGLKVHVISRLGD
jgi:membrane fusion protein (multidrug efflux system)